MYGWRRMRQWMTIMLSLTLALPLVFAPAVKAGPTDDEYDALRQRWYEMLTGGAYDPIDADIAVVIQEISDKAQTNLADMQTGAGRTYLWSELAAPQTNPTHIRLSYQKLYEMALAYRTAGSALEGDAALGSAVIDGLAFLHDNYYHAAATPYGNWWEWQIGAPLALNDTVVLMYDELPASAVLAYANAIKHFVAGPRDTGANRVWSCAVAIGRGILTKDGTTIRGGVNGLSPVFGYVTSGDGFYQDGSFIQHEKFAYNGSYGLSLIENLSTVLYWVSGSSWDVTDPQSANAYKWVDDSFIPFVYKGALMDMVRGRDISVYSRQDHATGHRMAAAILRMAQSAPEADAARYKSTIKYWLANDAGHSFYEGLPLDFIRRAKAIANDPAIVPAAEPVATTLYPAMDRALHLRPGFAVGISMFSKRIANYETTNGQNLKGWYTGAGMMYLYNGDTEQFGGNFWPTVNSYRLPGTTAVAGKPMTAEAKSTQSWVGGTSLADGYGTVGMAMEHMDGDTSGSMQAKKSWFLFDDEVVALGAGVTSTYPGNSVETIVDNRRLNAAGSNALTVNGTAKSSAIGWSETMTGVKWAHLSGDTPGSDIGYYFPGVATLDGLREQRSGKWFDISKYSGVLEPGDPTHTNRYLNLYLNHGVSPTDASYAYALLPNKTAAEVSDYASHPDFTILANNAYVQAVRENKLKATGANFWTKSEQTAGLITSSGQASVMFREQEDGLTLSVSDPNQPASGTVTIRLNASADSVVAADPRITVTRLSPYIEAIVAVGGSGGRAIEARFAQAANPATRVEAENYSSMNKVTRTVTTDVGGGYHISGSNETWTAYSDLDFGTGTDEMELRIATANTGGTLELRLDSVTGPLIGSLAVKNTGSWSTWTNVAVPLDGASGIHDLYLVFKKPDTLGVAAINWFEFIPASGELDKEPPSITLVPDTTAPTDQDVTVAAYIHDDAGVGVKKWAYGARNADDFRTGGTPLGDRFTAAANGIYTVYAQDLYGNETVATIEIRNITRGEPSIVLVPSPTSPTSGNVAVTAAVSVQSGLASLKYDYGRYDAAYFAAGGIELADPSVTMSVYDNGWLTVYVKDGNGNERVGQLEVANIDRDKPVIALNGDPVVRAAYGSVYTDAGATAWDGVDGDLSACVKITGDSVVSTVPGAYSIYYDVADSAGNAAERVVRTVIVEEGVDAAAPSWPVGSGANAAGIAPTSVTLSWPYASDDVGVAGYRIYIDGVERAEVPGEIAEYAAIGLTPNTRYAFKVTAYDPEGNENEGLAIVVYTLRSSGGSSGGGGGGSGGGVSPAPDQEVDHVPEPVAPEDDQEPQEPKQPAEEAEEASELPDVAGHWAEQAVRLAAQRGFVGGYPDGLFKPDAPVTRAAFSVMLAQALGLESDSSGPAFTDGEEIGAWAKEAVAAAARAGIVTGYGDGSFRPDARLTRAELAVMIARALKAEFAAEGTAPRFADEADIPGWARGAAAAVRDRGIVQGRSGNRFAPNAAATRAEAVVMLLRMQDGPNE
ncbi:polysaccharide lyase family 8 super-sandwich domain-containing protein [Cohnella cellulosilytica]|uniref:Polysaccharide lyase family 8 super-sandwich domain-containing protein n=1 Tax=Cohnella cellulosilytica TaxID=986710 RepID=A0ABW2FKC5_9BACL